jgi:hypothetical protein
MKTAAKKPGGARNITVKQARKELELAAARLAAAEKAAQRKAVIVAKRAEAAKARAKAEHKKRALLEAATLGPRQVAERYSVSISHVRDLCKRGDLPHRKSGERIIIPAAAARAYFLGEPWTSATTSSAKWSSSTHAFLLDETYRAEMRREVAAQDRGALTLVDVEHEADMFCCQIEPWSVTLPRLLVIENP